MVQYLLRAPRVIWRYDWDEDTDVVDAFVDTDFVGCKRTRRSTSGGVLMMGKHPVKHWSSTQPTVALSSGEAELTGILKGASMGLGFRSLAADLGLTLNLKVHSDSAAAIGISQRRGLGRVRHIAVGDLWIQEKLREGELELVKVLGSENPADIFTKPVERATLIKMMDIMALEQEGGRASSAPQVSNISLRMHNLIPTRKLLRMAASRASRSSATHGTGGLSRSEEMDLSPPADQARAQEQIFTTDQPSFHD